MYFILILRSRNVLNTSHESLLSHEVRESNIVRFFYSGQQTSSQCPSNGSVFYAAHCCELYNYVAVNKVC